MREALRRSKMKWRKKAGFPASYHSWRVEKNRYEDTLDSGDLLARPRIRPCHAAACWIRRNALLRRVNDDQWWK
jgi:hypothetical protein